jgi:regulatory protein
MKICYDYAIDYIYRFPKTKKELEIQLRKKWYNDEEIKYTFLWLEKKWYLDDVQFCRLYIWSELVKKWKPLYVVKGKLIKKWVDKKIIDQCLKEVDSDIEESKISTIKKLISKLKKSWIDWFDIIVKLNNRWYSIDDIKKSL